MIAKDQLEPYIAKNLSSHQIAKELGCSQTNVRYWIRKYGLKTNSKWMIERKAKSQEIMDGYKTCPKCQQKLELNADNFYMRRNGFHHWCKQCNNTITYTKQKEQKLRSVEYKGSKCCLCGYSKYVGALDFHHIDPSKKDFDLSSLRSYTWETVQKELDKCILVCRNCHAEIHGKVVLLDGFEPSTSPL